MSSPNDEAAAYVDAAAVLIGITVEPQWRADVAMQLSIILANIALVGEAEAAAASEPAPVFEAT